MLNSHTAGDKQKQLFFLVHISVQNKYMQEHTHTRIIAANFSTIFVWATLTDTQSKQTRSSGDRQKYFNWMQIRCQAQQHIHGTRVMLCSVRRNDMFNWLINISHTHCA